MARQNARAKVSGLKDAEKYVNSYLQGVQVDSFIGMIEAADFLKRKMDTEPPLIPRLTGDLIKSWFKDPQASKHRLRLEIGFDIPYAAEVHEMTSPFIRWTRAGSGPKWFEIHLLRNARAMADIIKTYAQRDKTMYLNKHQYKELSTGELVAIGGHRVNKALNK